MLVGTYGNVSDGSLGGDAGTLVVVLAQTDAALHPHGAGTDLGKHTLVSNRTIQDVEEVLTRR